MVVAITSAYFFSARQAKQYEATTSLIYEQNVDVTDPLNSGSQAQLKEYPAAAQGTADYLMLKQRLQGLVISKATATGNCASSPSLSSARTSPA